VGELLTSALAGYLAGAVPCADLVAHLASDGATDLREAGTRNPGAVNAMSVLGRRWGMAILTADVAKGAVACALGARLGGERGAHVAGTAAVVGHCLPMWSRFRGGKGVAVSLGQCLATFPVYLPADLGVAWAVGRWRGRTLPGTVAGSATWVAASLLWWWRGWPDLWGPGFARRPGGSRRGPGPLLPVSAAASSAMIVWRFLAARRQGWPYTADATVDVEEAATR